MDRIQIFFCIHLHNLANEYVVQPLVSSDTLNFQQNLTII